MDFLIIYCAIWTVCCGVSALLWEDYDPKDLVQTFSLVVVNLVWPVLIATWVAHAVSSHYEEKERW